MKITSNNNSHNYNQDGSNDDFLMKISRPPITNNRPTTNHLQKSPARHREIYVKGDYPQRPSTTISFTTQYTSPRYVRAKYPTVRKTLFTKELDKREVSGPFAYFHDNIATTRAKSVLQFDGRTYCSHRSKTRTHVHRKQPLLMYLGNEKNEQTNMYTKTKNKTNKPVKNTMWKSNNNGSKFSKSNRFYYPVNTVVACSNTEIPQQTDSLKVKKSAISKPLYPSLRSSNINVKRHNYANNKREYFRHPSTTTTSTNVSLVAPSLPNKRRENCTVTKTLRLDIPNINLIKKYRKSISESTENLFKHLQRQYKRAGMHIDKKNKKQTRNNKMKREGKSQIRVYRLYKR
jgi:hypothetical protein